MIVLIITGIILICCAVFDIPIYDVILTVIGVFLIALIFAVIDIRREKEIAVGIVKARLISECAIYKKKHEYTGDSFGKGGRRAHYQYVDVIDHYDCTFSVVYNDGRRDELKSCKGSYLSASLSTSGILSTIDKHTKGVYNYGVFFSCVYKGVIDTTADF